jgi:hypothetical protein
VSGTQEERLAAAREVVAVAAADTGAAEALAVWLAQRADVDGLAKLAEHVRQGGAD